MARTGLHWLSSGIPCKPGHVTWASPGITTDPALVGCRRCQRYLADPRNWTPGNQPDLSAVPWAAGSDE